VGVNLVAEFIAPTGSTFYFTVQCGKVTSTSLTQTESLKIVEQDSRSTRLLFPLLDESDVVTIFTGRSAQAPVLGHHIWPSAARELDHRDSGGKRLAQAH
jgi:hypothetical protein